MTVKIGTKIFGGFLIVLLLTCVVAGFGYFQLTSLSDTMDTMIHEDVQRVIDAYRVRVNFESESANLRGYMLTYDKTFLDNYQKAVDENQSLAQEQINTATTVEGKKLTQGVKDYEDKYASLVSTKFLPLIRKQKMEEALTVMNSELIPMASEGKQVLDDLVDLRLKDMEETSKKVAYSASRADMLMLIITAIAVVIGVALTFVMTKSVTRPIRLLTEGAHAIASGDLTRQVTVKGRDELGQLALAFNNMGHDLRDMTRKMVDIAGELGSSSEELSASSQETTAASEQVSTTITDMAARATDQAATAEETSNVVDQMTAKTQQMAANIASVSQSSNKSVEDARAGQGQAQDAVIKIQQVQKVAEQTAEAIGRLDEKSKTIGKIVDVIDGIADQTNLLALNAAIEAARAGEQGRGFAVVADEVRKLAEQSGQSTEQISTIIRDIQEETDLAAKVMEKGFGEVNHAVDAVNNAGDSFAAIFREIEQVTRQIQDVSLAAQQMAGGAEQIAHSIDNMAAIAEETASSTQEISAAAQEQTASMEAVAESAQNLAKLGENLQGLAARFKV